MVSSHVSLMRWVASYQWRRGLGDYSVWWIYRAGAELKYGRCREETQKETSLTLNETVPLTVGKGTAHLIQKAKTLLGYLREPRQLYERTKATRNSCSSCWLLFSFLLVRIMYREVFIYVYSYVVF
ncbi:uncharacterized protein LOC133800261 isoform X1 [Humulus lupulus]|uniref:uncharacterized protein LOC133800261 isoform X1 n=1 Tax=Humulus lupulus TaxID=3486 RepID=UPI002B400EDE|nr:uncharacterized protein LOC133800261 isoform X1 [Humulus lupulus]